MLTTTRRDAIFQVRLSPDEKRMLTTLSRLMRVTLSDVVRLAIGEQCRRLGVRGPRKFDKAVKEAAAKGKRA